MDKNNKKLLATLTALSAFGMSDALAHELAQGAYSNPSAYKGNATIVVDDDAVAEAQDAAPIQNTAPQESQAQTAAVLAPQPVNTAPVWMNNMTSMPGYSSPAQLAPSAGSPAVSAAAQAAATEPNNINVAITNPAGATGAAPATGEFIPATAPNYAEAGLTYYNVTKNYGNTFSEFVNAQYQTDPWNRWSAGVQHSTAFKDEGEAFAIANTHTFNEDWYSDVGIGVGSGASFLTRDRIDVAINRKWLENRNWITTLGFTYDDSNNTYSDKTLHLATAYYFQTMPLVAQAGFNLNDSDPGSVIAPSGFGALTYGYQKHFFLTGRYAIAREAYQLLGSTANITNGFTSHTFDVILRQWVGDDWGFNIGTEYYTNPYYDRYGGTFSVFKEFGGPMSKKDFFDWSDSASGNKPNGFYFAPYVGGDYQYTWVNYAKSGGIDYGDIFESSLNGGDVHVGARIHKYLGFEGSYYDTASAGRSNVLGTGIKTGIKFSGETLDAMGYLPVEQTNAELIGVLGVARATVKDTAKGGGFTVRDNGAEYEPRVGAGAQYWVSDRLNVRGLLTYQDSGFEGFDNTLITNVGVNYKF